MAGPRPSPRSSAKRIVLPEREVPGKATATSCARPKTTASFHDTSVTTVRPRSQNSPPIKSTPPMSSASAMGALVSGSARPSFFIVSAPTAVIVNASNSFKK